MSFPGLDLTSQYITLSHNLTARLREREKNKQTNKHTYTFIHP